MVVNAVEGICAIKGENVGALLETKHRCERHALDAAGDRHAVLTPRLEQARQLCCPHWQQKVAPRVRLSTSPEVAGRAFTPRAQRLTAVCRTQKRLGRSMLEKH